MDDVLWAYKRHQLITLYQLQRTSHPLMYTLKGICDDTILDYNYRHVFQAALNLTSDIELGDTFNPTTNVRVTFTGGDNPYYGDFICALDDRTGSLNDIYSQYKVYKLNTCAYEPDIITSAACPPQCRINNSASITNGDYGNTFKFARCFDSNIRYSLTKEPSNSPTNNPTWPPYITWIDNIKLINKSDYIYTFETNVGCNITYALYYFVKGHLNNKYYKLSHNMEHNINFTLFCSTVTHKRTNIIGIGNINENNCAFGYTNQPHKNNLNVESLEEIRQIHNFMIKIIQLKV